MVDCLEHDGNIGIVGPKIYYYTKNVIFSLGGTIDRWTARTPFIGFGKRDEDVSDQELEVEFVSGCALLIRNKLINDIGLLFEGYFAYYEDADWCLKASNEGYKVVVSPKANIWHKIGATSKKSKLYNYLIVRNRFIFIRRNFTPIEAISSCLFSIFLYVPFLLIVGLYNKDYSILNDLLKGIYDGLKQKL
jgi:GT2 family glycosyltransferase